MAVNGCFLFVPVRPLLFPNNCFTEISFNSIEFCRLEILPTRIIGRDDCIPDCYYYRYLRGNKPPVRARWQSGPGRPSLFRWLPRCIFIEGCIPLCLFSIAEWRYSLLGCGHCFPLTLTPLRSTTHTLWNRPTREPGLTPVDWTQPQG